MKFIECCKSYDDSERLFEQGVSGCPVVFPELDLFDKARKKFANLVSDMGLHGDWEEAVKLFAIIHAKVARTPCRPSWLISDMLDQRGGSRVIDKVEARSASVDPTVKQSLVEVKELLWRLSETTWNPLLEPVSNLQKTDERTIFILRDMRLWEEARACLSEVLSTSNWELMKPASLRAPQLAGRMLIFGPLWYLLHRGEEYLLRSPVAGTVHLIACAHEFSGQIRISCLDDDAYIPVEGAPPPPEESSWEYEPIPPVKRGQLRFKLSGESRVWESGRRVAAVPFRLGKGRGTYFGIESSVWVVKADTHGDNPTCSGVEKVPVEEIDAGDLVLMTTSGGGDMIPVVADIILHDSPAVRALQRKWKEALRCQVQRYGLSYVASQLEARGAKKASPVNVRVWCSVNPRSIGMEHLDTDLKAVLNFTGMLSSYDDVRSGIDKLRSAHQSAGSQLQSKLFKLLEGMDLSEVFRQGEMEIKEGDGPAKTVLLIEERGEECEVPEEWEGELREVDD